MNAQEWTLIEHFKSVEFDSPDAPGSGFVEMHWRFLSKLDSLRDDWGKPMTINSGFRTAAHNAKCGGKPNSAHLRGYAADIRTKDLRDAIALAIKAAGHGFERIGVDLHGRYVHLDVDDSLPVATWFYNLPDTEAQMTLAQGA